MRASSLDKATWKEFKIFFSKCNGEGKSKEKKKDICLAIIYYC